MKQSLLMILSLLFLLISETTHSQDDTAAVSPEQFGISHLTEFLGLKPDDIGFRSDYTEPDSFRLKVVAELMQ
jgi:hypothetical protein